MELIAFPSSSPSTLAPAQGPSLLLDLFLEHKQVLLIKVGPFVALQLRLVCRSLKETVHRFSPSLAAFPTPERDFLPFLQLPAGLGTLRVACTIEFAFWPIRGVLRPQVYSSKTGLLQMDAIESMIKDKKFGAITELMTGFEAETLRIKHLEHTGNLSLPPLTASIKFSLKRLFGNPRNIPEKPFLVYRTLDALRDTWQSTEEVEAILRVAIRSQDPDLLAEVLAIPGCNLVGNMVFFEVGHRKIATALGYACLHCLDPRKVLSLLVDKLASNYATQQTAITVVDEFLAGPAEPFRSACKAWEAKVDYVTDGMRATDFSSPIGVFFWLLGYMRYSLGIPELSALDSNAFWTTARADKDPNHHNNFPDCIARRASKVFGVGRSLAYVARGLSAGHVVSLKRVAEEELVEPEAKRARTEATIVLD